MSTLFQVIYIFAVDLGLKLKGQRRKDASAYQASDSRDRGTANVP